MPTVEGVSLSNHRRGGAAQSSDKDNVDWEDVLTTPSRRLLSEAESRPKINRAFGGLRSETPTRQTSVALSSPMNLPPLRPPISDASAAQVTLPPLSSLGLPKPSGKATQTPWEPASPSSTPIPNTTRRPPGERNMQPSGDFDFSAFASKAFLEWESKTPAASLESALQKKRKT